MSRPPVPRPEGRGPVTMAMADRFEERGEFGLAQIARTYAVDRPRWWHRFVRPKDAN